MDLAKTTFCIAANPKYAQNQAGQSFAQTIPAIPLLTIADRIQYAQ